MSRPPRDARALAFRPGEDALYGAGWFDLYRWSLDSGEIQVLDTDHRGRIHEIRFSIEGKRLASISGWSDSAVLILDPATGRTLEHLEPHALCGAAVAFSLDGNLLASTSDDGSIHLWNLSPHPPALSP